MSNVDYAKRRNDMNLLNFATIIELRFTEYDTESLSYWMDWPIGNTGVFPKNCFIGDKLIVKLNFFISKKEYF